MTAKDKYFNSCSLTAVMGGKAREFNDECVLWDCVKGLREVKTFTFHLELCKDLC